MDSFHPRRGRWFQISLKTLFVAMLVVAAYFGGFATAQRRAEKAIHEAQQEAEAALQASRRNEQLLESMAVYQGTEPASAAERAMAIQRAFNELRTTTPRE